MKQEITTDDLQMLNSKGVEKYYEYLKKMDYYCSGARDYGYSGAVFYYLNKMHGLDIGELIEFLEKNSDSSERDIEQFFTKVLDFGKYSDKTLVAIGWTGELCDCLWAAAVEILNKE